MNDELNQLRQEVTALKAQLSRQKMHADKAAEAWREKLELQKAKLDHQACDAAHALQRLPHFTRYCKTRTIKLENDDPRYTLIESALKKSLVRHRPYQDAPHCPAPVLEVDRIERIMSPRLQDKYTSELQDLAGLCERRCTPIRPAVDAIQVETYEGLPLNEFLLFHGLPFDLVSRVCMQGLDPRYAGEHMGKLFGHGTYLASNASKSDIYTTPDPTSGMRCLLLVRTCLGEAEYASQSCPGVLRPKERRDGRGPLNSVVARTLRSGGVVEHPEYIVFKESQALPEFMIHYKHAEACQCTHCVKRYDIIVNLQPRAQPASSSRPPLLRLRMQVMDHFSVGHVAKLIGESKPFPAEYDSEGISLNLRGAELRSSRPLSGLSISRPLNHNEFPIPTDSQFEAFVDLKPMIIFVRMETGSLPGSSPALSLIELTVNPSCTIARIKDRVEELKGIPHSIQRLIFGGNVLEDSRTLAECHIQKGCTLSLLPVDTSTASPVVSAAASPSTAAGSASSSAAAGPSTDEECMICKEGPEDDLEASMGEARPLVRPCVDVRCMALFHIGCIAMWRRKMRHDGKVPTCPHCLTPF